jgi:hypothetical protein
MKHGILLNEPTAFKFPAISPAGKRKSDGAQTGAILPPAPVSPSRQMKTRAALIDDHRSES